MTSERDVIKSPYHPGYYNNNTDCHWLINVKPGFLIRLSFEAFNVEYDSRCLKDYVEVVDGLKLTDPSLGRFCGSVYPAVVESTSNQMLVRFKTDSSIVNSGFRAHYASVKGEF